jgi:stearoyl-CoA desaturase (delta-9 desaturase)
MATKTLNFIAPKHAQLKKRIANLYLVGLPIVASLFWLLNFRSFPFTWVEVSCFLFFYVTTGLAIGLGFHRCFSHQSYRAIRPLKWLMLLFGSMACQGSVVRWVADHRRHHRLTDQE